MASGQSVTSVHLRAPRNDELLGSRYWPALYEPHLVAIGQDSILLRGYESTDGGSHVQEWNCVLDVR